VLDDVILFDNDSPRVRRVSWPLVEKVARFILANPDILEIDIEGHADRVGTDAHNLQLSRERAEAVKRLLLKYGVQGDRVNARGFGESRPKTGSRAARVDRRVEFWVVRARPQDPRSGTTP
jgi:outer membrane protein OmpA-like peptidoglycan-associated protein